MQDNAFTNKVKSIWAFIKRIAVRVWKYLKVAKMEWIVLVSLFALDLISKAIVQATVKYGTTVNVIPYFLNIHNLHNYAAAFGSDFLRKWFGDIGSRIFFCVFAVAASVALAIVLIKNKGRSKWLRVSLALFIAGAMGNCIDRMFLGYVRDFVEFVFFGQTWFGRTTWYVFNIADAELVIGVIMIVIYFLFLYKDKKKSEEFLTDELGEIEPIDSTGVTVATSDSTDEQNVTAATKVDIDEGSSENMPVASESVEDVLHVENGDTKSDEGLAEEHTIETEQSAAESAATENDVTQTEEKPKPKRKRASGGGADKK